VTGSIPAQTMPDGGLDAAISCFYGPAIGVAMTAFITHGRAACLLIAAGIGLGGCLTSSPQEVDPNLFPANYRKDVVDTLTKLLDDPTNLREAGISDPVIKPVSGTPRYVTCVKFNPRNANHDYTGVVERVGYFYGGALTQLVKPSADECRGAAYKPFPELEKICFGTKCV
jgi:hypothetical protein